MPILGNFPSGGGGGTGGLTLAAVTDIQTLAAAGKVYVKWTDPDDLVVAGSTLAAWGGTLLVRKAGSAPVSRRDGTVVLDSKARNAYQSGYFCDSGLTDGVTYYYKLFPYTTQGAYTDSEDDVFNATPNPVAIGNVSGMSAVAAGNGKLNIKWTDPAATVVQDGVTLATWANTTVVVKAGSYATSPDDSAAAYRKVCTTRNGNASTPLTVTGLTNGTTYYISFFPISTDGKVNVNASNRITGVPNRLTISTVPSQRGSLTYNGNAQSPSWSGYDASKMTLGGTTSGTNAGSYNATFTPKDDYCWSGGATTAKTVAWSIAKAAGSLSVNPPSVTLNPTTKSAAVTVTRAGNGAITATSDNTGVATVSVSGNVVTISSVNETTGTATITVKVAAGTNHTAPANKTIPVTATFVSNVLNENSWETIKGVSDKGQGTNYWKIGDTKTIVLNGKIGNTAISNLSMDAFIIGFNHNSAKEGANRIHFQLGKIGGKMVGLYDSKYGPDNGWPSAGTGYFAMNGSNTNNGGWNASYARKTLLGNSNTPTSPLANSFMAALPADLRAVMKPVTKYTDNTANGGGNQAGYITATTDYLWLLAEFEVQGARSYANSYEKDSQLQYDYYKSGNSKIAYKYNATGSAVYWWLRSARYYTHTTFCHVDTDGSANDYSANYSLALLPGFAA